MEGGPHVHTAVSGRVFSRMTFFHGRMALKNGRSFFGCKPWDEGGAGSETGVATIGVSEFTGDKSLLERFHSAVHNSLRLATPRSLRGR